MERYVKVAQITIIVFTSLTGLWLMFGAIPVQANGSITVTTTTDVIANDGQCSLREAIIAANTDITFNNCSAGSGADTITFSPALSLPAVFVLTIAGPHEDNARTGDLDLTGTLTISAPIGTGEAETNFVIIDGNDLDRVFEIRPGARATISGLTVRQGNAGADFGGGLKVLGSLTMRDSLVERNHGDGIYNVGGLLTLNRVEVNHNTAGYGIRNQDNAWTTFANGVIRGNQVGGFYNNASTAMLSQVVIISNTGSGGIYNSGFGLTRLTLEQSLIATNTATSGGGIFNEGIGAKANIYQTQIRGNVATSGGGGVFNNGTMTWTPVQLTTIRPGPGGASSILVVCCI